MERPWVVLMSAMTVDGRIASKANYSKLSCPIDLRRLHEERARSDAVMVGGNTVRIDDPRLALKYVRGRNPIRATVSRALDLPLNARIFNVADAPTVVFTTRHAPRDRVEQLRSRGVDVVVHDADEVDLAAALAYLRDRYGVRRLLVEGGGRLHWGLLSRCLADELVVTVTPYVFGAGRSLVEGDGWPDTESVPFLLRLVSAQVCECGNEVVVRYRVECRGHG